MLYGRESPQADIARLLDAVRSGHSGVLVIRGEPGIGKSALLDEAATAATGLRVLRAAGVEAESALPFAALQMLLRPAMGRLDALPGPQASALRGALGLSAATGEGRFLIGLAVLTLLTDLAEERPVLCLIDDAHWLDPASAEVLLFTARRLGIEGIALVFAARDDADNRFDAAGLAESVLAGLDQDDAAAVLAEHAARLAPDVRDRVVAESAGNPLALLELAAGLSDEQRAGRVGMPLALPVAERVLSAFRQQIDRLPDKARLLLLVAAAEGTGDVNTVLRAGRMLGAGAADFDLAERAGLLRVTGMSVAFRHPLVRSAAYQGAALAARLAVHDALARVLDGDRRVWHRAAAVTGPDEEIAAELERAAQRARARGALAAAVPIFEQAARFSPDRADQGSRLTLAAQAAITAGRTEHAAELARRATELTRDPLLLAGLAMVSASVEFERGTPRGAVWPLIDRAEPISSSFPGMALTLLIIAAGNAWSAGEDDSVRRVAELAGTLGEVTEPGAGGDTGAVTGTSADAIVAAIEALGRLAGDDYATALPPLRTLVDSARSRPPDGLIPRIFVNQVALLLGDDDTALALAAADVTRSRALGQAGALPRTLHVQAQAQVMAGMQQEASATVAEALEFADITGQRHRLGRLTAVTARIAAIEGDEERCRELAGVARGRSSGGLAEAVAESECALGLLDLGLGRYEKAMHGLAAAIHGPARHTAPVLFALPDFIEAAARAEAPERADAAFARFTAWAELANRQWASAVASRCRGLVSPVAEAGDHYARAVRLHAGGGRPFERARTELLYGEWLRRARRRADARTPLRSALDIFTRLHATPWAERARAELRATGETTPAAMARAEDVLGVLTPQELQIVRLAAGGMSNRDIAAQLFLSHRTVEYHLYKAYPKLGVRSRAELTRFGLGRVL